MDQHIFQVLNIAPGLVEIKELTIAIDVKLAYQKLTIIGLYSREEAGITQRLFEISISPCRKVIWEDLSLADNPHYHDGTDPYPEMIAGVLREDDKGKYVVVGTAYFEVIAYGEITVSKTW